MDSGNTVGELHHDHGGEETSGREGSRRRREVSKVNVVAGLYTSFKCPGDIG